MRKIEELGLEYKTNRWTEDEEALLRELAPKYYIREIAKRFNRTEAAVITKARNMGLKIITSKRDFSTDEINYIKNNWGIIPVTDMARVLQVSRIMIDNQAKKMNLPSLGNNPYRKWTEEKIEKLRSLSSKKSITALARYFHTTNDAISSIAHDNKIELIDSKVHWTEEDNELLRKYAKEYTLPEIAEKMNRNTAAVRLQAKRLKVELISPENYLNSVWTEDNSRQLIILVEAGKTVLEIIKIMNKKEQTIIKKAKELGLTVKKEEQRPWTKEETEKLIELSKTKKISELVLILGRSTTSIKSKAKSIGITIHTDRKNWSKEEYELLQKLVEEKKTPKEIAAILNRTEESIIIKISRRGLKIQTNDKRYWTKEEEELLSDLWGNMSADKIAEKLNRTVSSVKNKAFQLELGSQIENNYDGLTISEIVKLFNVSHETVSIYWVSLGLQYTSRKLSKTKKYRYVTIENLLSFLEKNQNIWDSRYLEKNILGKEPDWMIEKRKRDKEMPLGYYGIDRITKQQLIQTKKYILDNYSNEEKGIQYKKKRGNN